MTFTGNGRNTALVGCIKVTPGRPVSSSPYTTTVSRYLSSGTMTASYTTGSVAPANGAQGTIYIAAPIPTTPCLADGFLSQYNVMYRVDISRGNMTQIFTMDLGNTTNGLNNGVNGVNSLAYNSIDNYMYGTIRGPTPETFIRIGYDGSYQPLFSLPGTTADPQRFYVGDIDNQGQYYTASQTNGWRWMQINLNPNTAGYGQVVTSGSTTVPAGGLVQDWAFVPGGGANLYAIAVDEFGTTTLNAFQLSSKNWTIIATYPQTTVTRASINDGTNNPRFNALYASSNGYLYGSEGYSGQLWRFTIQAPFTATYVVQGPKAADADGARCITNTAPI